jgi:hypothetical protein
MKIDLEAGGGMFMVLEYLHGYVVSFYFVFRNVPHSIPSRLFHTALPEFSLLETSFWLQRTGSLTEFFTNKVALGHTFPRVLQLFHTQRYAYLTALSSQHGTRWLDLSKK